MASSSSEAAIEETGWTILLLAAKSARRETLESIELQVSCAQKSGRIPGSEQQKMLN